MLCIWMKMHSYCYVNRDLYLEYKSKKNPTKTEKKQTQTQSKTG